MAGQPNILLVMAGKPVPFLTGAHHLSGNYSIVFDATRQYVR